MKISLNKANKIRNQLGILSFPRVVTVGLRTDVSQDQNEALLKAAETLFLSQYGDECRKLGFLSNLRNLIQRANHENSINELMGGIVFYESLIQLSSTVLMETKRALAHTSFEDFNKDIWHNTAMAEKGPEFIKPPNKVNVRVLSKEFIENLEKEIRVRRKDLEDLQEQRNKKNHEVLIEIPQDMEKFLREHDLL